MEPLTPRTYHIEIEAPAWKVLMNFEEKLREKIFDKIYTLELNPRPSGCKKLKDKGGLYRVRIGDYRVIYSIQDDKLIVIIVEVFDRKEGYD